MKERSEFHPEAAVRAMLPTLILFLLVIVMAIPLRSSLSILATPALPLLAMFIWLVRRPSAVPALAAFCLGLFHDILIGSPMGIHAIVYVVAHAAITTQRRFFVGRSFPVIWLGFASVIFGCMMLAWLLASLYYMTLLSPDDTLLSAVVTVCVYPVFAWLFLYWGSVGDKAT